MIIMYRYHHRERMILLLLPKFNYPNPPFDFIIQVRYL